MLAIRLPKEIEKRLSALAKKTGRSKSFYVREAIIAHLDELENDYLADYLLAEIHSLPVKAIPLEDVIKKFGRAG